MPTFDELNLALSRQVDDPVGAAGTNGQLYSSARRIDALNQAIREFIRLQISVIDPSALYVRVLNIGALSNYIGNEAKNLASSATALSGFTGGLAWILSVRNTTNAATVEPVPQTLKGKAQVGDNRYLAPSTIYQLFVIEAGSILVLGSGATDSITVQYIKQHTDLSAGGTILIPSEYHQDILDLAVARALEYNPSGLNISRSTLAKQRVYQKYAA